MQCEVAIQALSVRKALVIGVSNATRSAHSLRSSSSSVRESVGGTNRGGRSELRVSEIAYEVGFQSLTHFNRVFRRVVGKSPTAYRGKLAVG